MSIDIVFLEDGSLHIRTRGFQGKQCLEEVEKILQSLEEQGVETKTVNIMETEEMHQNVSQKQKQRTLES